MNAIHTRCSRATEAKPLCGYDCPECRGSMYGFPRGKDDAGKYEAFVMRKSQLASDGGFAPLSIPDFLFPFQRMLVEWACRKGRAAILADCGMGKTPCQLVWADNVACHTNGRVLILTPLAVTSQTIREGEKFGIECVRSVAGELPPGQHIIVTNYERLHHFRPDDFAGVVCDEASILKSFEGTTRAAIVEFMRTRPYRLLCTATAAPNDYVELGNSAEALGQMGFMDMLTRFFKNDRNNASLQRAWASQGGGSPQWRFKGHAEVPFWRWVASWARAIRKPSDLGFEDGAFVLPPLTERTHIVRSPPREGMLFALPAIGLAEERQERRATLSQRCEMAASLVNGLGKPAIMWCHLNDEGDLLEKLVPDSIQVSGRDSDDEKEEKFLAFVEGKARALVTKPIVGAWGLNFQHCAHMTTFASHSFEMHYQSVRRMWRFGQTCEVIVDHIIAEGESGVLANFQRKSERAEKMFDSIIGHMRDAMHVEPRRVFEKQEECPSWL